MCKDEKRRVETEKPIKERELFSTRLFSPAADRNFEHTKEYQHILFFIYIFCQPSSKTQDESIKQPGLREA